MSGVANAHTVDEVIELLSRAVGALAPYSASLVLAGGLVPIFYRRMPQFRAPDSSAAATKDIDIVIPRNLPKAGPLSIPEALAAVNIHRVRIPSLRVGGPDVEYFQDESKGTERLADVYLEFLAPARSGAVTMVSPQPDLWVQSLGDLALLFHEPLEVDSTTLFGATRSVVTIRLAGPITLILQKIRARRERPEGKRHSDLAAVYDVALLSQPTWDDERKSVARLCQAEGPWAGIVKHALNDLDALLADEGAIAGAVQVAQASGATATDTQMVRVLRQFRKAVS